VGISREELADEVWRVLGEHACPECTNPNNLLHDTALAIKARLIEREYWYAQGDYD